MRMMVAIPGISWDKFGISLGGTRRSVRDAYCLLKEAANLMSTLSEVAS